MNNVLFIVEQTPQTPQQARDAMLAEMVRETDEWLASPIFEQTDPDATVAFVFELIHMGRALEYHLVKVADGTEMTALQARFAWILAATPWAMPQQNIRVALGLSQAAVSQMITRMRARGLVECDTSDDGRNALVALTEHGRQQWAEVRDQLATVTQELHDAVGALASPQFRVHASEVAALDDRHGYFEALRNPLRFLP